jgi:hypothetical protein
LTLLPGFGERKGVAWGVGVGGGAVGEGGIGVAVGGCVGWGATAVGLVGSTGAWVGVGGAGVAVGRSGVGVKVGRKVLVEVGVEVGARAMRLPTEQAVVTASSATGKTIVQRMARLRRPSIARLLK